MLKLRYLYSFALLIITPSTYAVNKACWEENPTATEYALHSLCASDTTYMGTGLKVGTVQLSISSSSGKQKFYCVYKDEKSGVIFNDPNFIWLNMYDNPDEQSKNLPINKYIHTFVAEINYCRRPKLDEAALQLRNPDDSFIEDTNQYRICYKKEGNNAVLGSYDEDDKCIDTWGVKYPYKAPTSAPAATNGEPSSPPSGEHKSSEWVQRTYAGWAYDITGIDAHGKEIRDSQKLKCGKHCRNNAQKLADKLGKRFMTTDRDYYVIGDHVDRNNRDHGKNEVYENLNAKP